MEADLQVVLHLYESTGIPDLLLHRKNVITLLDFGRMMRCCKFGKSGAVSQRLGSKLKNCSSKWSQR